VAVLVLRMCDGVLQLVLLGFDVVDLTCENLHHVPLFLFFFEDFGLQVVVFVQILHLPPLDFLFFLPELILEEAEQFIDKI